MDWPENIGIVGGGVIGLTSAFVINELARADGANTTVDVLEKSTFGSGSTERAGCGIRTFYTSQTNIQLAQAGLRFWRNAEHTLDENIAFRENGYLFLTPSEAQAEELKSRVHKQHAVGEQAIDATGKISEYGKFVDGSEYKAGVFTPEAALADPELMVHALVETLQNRSTCNLYYGTTVNSINPSGRIETTEASRTYDVLVNAAGAWGVELAEEIGESFPVNTQARRLAELNTKIHARAPLSVDLETGVYALPKVDGTALVGGYFGDEDRTTHPDSPAAFTRSRDENWENELFSKIERLSPELADAEVTKSWAGIYSMTDSHRPFIERTGDVIHALGFSGHGIMQAPGAAQVVAALATEDVPPLVSVEQLKRGRPPVQTDIQF